MPEACEWRRSLARAAASDGHSCYPADQLQLMPAANYLREFLKLGPRGTEKPAKENSDTEPPHPRRHLPATHKVRFVPTTEKRF